MDAERELQTRAINTIRFLSVDAVQKANSGHPGLPMGTAAIAYTLWAKHLKINPENPKWFDRDRFILSGGHGSMLLYSLLFLSGYDLSLEELKNFRQWGSRTPGHPEVGLTPGVETTTGPLGQGFANGLGMAIAEAHLGAEFNRPGHDIVNHYTYAIVTDGDLMEGITSEAASLAGHLRLGKLIYFYDDNHITIEGSTELAFTEDRAARFAAYQWQVLHVNDGNNVDEIDHAIQQAKEDPRPSLIICRTVIGFGLPTKQGTEKAHGEAPGEEEIIAAKKNMNWPIEPKFLVPDDVLVHFRAIKERGAIQELEWNEKVHSFAMDLPDLASEFKRRINGELPVDWDKTLTTFSADSKGMATRQSSGKMINEIAKILPELVGGSADLATSNKTWIDGYPDFQSSTPEGRNFHFGVREHAMGAIVNGMALHSGLIPYGGTFLVFSDYMRGALRISALSKIPSIWVFTHDSIGVGEDGPTHQPIEHLASLRAIPNFMVIRPADANETREAWRVAIEHRNGPTALILTRQNLPTIDRTKFAPASDLKFGAYVLADLGDSKPSIILMASGSEVPLIIEAAQRLVNEGKSIRIVSFPSWELFRQQPEEYQEKVLPKSIQNRLAVEAAVPMGWDHWVNNRGAVIGISHFGASAPADTLFKEFGFTVENVVAKAKELLGK